MWNRPTAAWFRSLTRWRSGAHNRPQPPHDAKEFMARPTSPDPQIGLIDTGTVAPVVPTSSAAVRLRPLGLHGSRIDGGLWADRRRTNHDVTIPHGAAQLQAVGNLTNFEMAAGGGGKYRGAADDTGNTAPFLDSDVHKWLEAVGWELSQSPDPALLSLAEPLIDLIARTQRPDGYVDSFYQAALPGKEFTNFEWGHELYVAGHLVQAALAWQRGLGDDRLLRIARRFVERIDVELGPGRREAICGHPEFEMALVELYRATGEGHYLEIARTLVERRGHGLLGKCRHGARYWQDHQTVRAATEPAGHAVRQLYLDCGVVDVAIETGDQELLDAAIHRWESMVSSRTYLTGGIGSHHMDEGFGDAYELPADRAYAETCAAIASVMLSWRLLLATGESRFADLIERTAFNAVLPSLAFDGSHFFYANPLMRRSFAAEVVEGNATTRRAPWLDIPCCPPNLMRFLATFPDLAATASEQGLQLHQYVTGSVESPVKGGVVQVMTSTAYPWSGDVEIAISRTVREPWTLSLRVPEWCANATASLAGTDPLRAAGPGTIEITREWREGDRVVLALEMAPVAIAPDPRIDAVRGSLALERGPLVYAVEDADLAPGETIESVEIEAQPNLDSEVRTEPGLGDLTWLSFDAVVRADLSRGGWPYRRANRPAAESGPSNARRLRALPYFAWGNRPGLGMRVWIPTRSRDKTA